LNANIDVHPRVENTIFWTGYEHRGAHTPSVLVKQFIKTFCLSMYVKLVHDKNKTILRFVAKLFLKLHQWKFKLAPGVIEHVEAVVDFQVSKNNFV
jgi:hypothetical protein